MGYWSSEIRSPSGASAWLQEPPAMLTSADFCIQVPNVLRRADGKGRGYFTTPVVYKQFIKGFTDVRYVPAKGGDEFSGHKVDHAGVCKAKCPGGGLDGDLQEDTEDSSGGFYNVKLGRAPDPVTAAHGFYDVAANTYLFYDAPGWANERTPITVGGPVPGAPEYIISSVIFSIEITHYIATGASASGQSASVGLWKGRFRIENGRFGKASKSPTGDFVTFRWLEDTLLDGDWSLRRR